MKERSNHHVRSVVKRNRKPSEVNEPLERSEIQTFKYQAIRNDDQKSFRLTETNKSTPILPPEIKVQSKIN